MKLNPLKYSKQHLKQRQATVNNKPIRALFWGNRVGKTEWGAQEVARYVLGEHPFRKIAQPVEIWCACPSYDQQKETTQKKLERYLPSHRIKHRTHIKSNTWGELILDNGSRINFKSYEQGREKFQGAGKRLIWFDEEPPKDIWEECFVRAEAGIPLDIILTMTPINGLTWVYDDIYLDTTNQDIYVSEADWDDNPYLTIKQKDQMARGLSPQAIEVRRKGKFVKKTGLVCPWWNRTDHLADLAFNRDWEIGAALDFGFSNPCCFGLIGADFDDNLNLFDGFYERGLVTPKLAAKIERLCEPYGINPRDITIVGDSAQAESIQALNDMGFNVIGITKQSKTDQENWDEYRADKMAAYGADGKIKVSKNLTYFNEKEGKEQNWFVKEIEGLKWSEVASPSSSEKQQGARWDPRYPNHAIDMLSYYLIDHLEAPAIPEQPKPWDGKIPGTYVPPSLDEDKNNWNMVDLDDRFEDMV